MIQNKFYKISDYGYKVALLSDIHYSEHYDLEIFKQIVANLKEHKPNYICISGDIIDTADILYNSDIIERLTEFFKSLSEIGQVIVSLGNHDIIKYNSKKEEFEKVNQYFLKLNTIENVHYLNNKCLVRDELCFIGFNPGFEYYYGNSHEKDVRKLVNELDKIEKIKPNLYNIMLCHSPRQIINNYVLDNSKNILKINLILSGHMHNGLVFKFLDKTGNRGLIGPWRSFFPKYARGLVIKKINDKEIKLIISGGVIKFSELSPKFFHRLNKLYPIHIDYIEV